MSEKPEEKITDTWRKKIEMIGIDIKGLKKFSLLGAYLNSPAAVKLDNTVTI